MTEEFDVVVEKDSEGFFVATVPVLPGCHTQARSLDELMVRVKEAIELCLEVQGARPPRHVTTRHDQAAAGGLRYRTAGFRFQEIANAASSLSVHERGQVTPDDLLRDPCPAPAPRAAAFPKCDARSLAARHGLK